MKRFQFDSKWVKYIGGAIGGVLAGIILMVGTTKVVYPAISQLVGLSVAQSATIWNNVADAAKGDALSSGILAQSPYLWNGLSFDRQRGTITNGALVDIRGVITAADATANPTTLNPLQSFPELFNGTTWDRARSASGANNTQTTVLGAQQVTVLSTWSVLNTQAGAVQATASKTAGAGTIRHVATGITACLADTTAVTTPLTANLRDGATGAGTIIRSWLFTLVAGTALCQNITGLNMVGSANTAMTIEFAAAGSATSAATVTLTGYSTP